MAVTGLERRRSRASFKRTLERICSRLTETPVTSTHWNERFFGLCHEMTAEVTSLWVAGSFARGALYCGDLDLILEYRVVKGVNGGGRRVARALFNSLPDVRVYGGRPEENDSGIAFPEAILVWQGADFDWRHAIAEIHENPDATRFARPTDRIPFRAEQLSADVEQLEEIAEMEAHGTVVWTFTPVTQIEPAPPISDEESNLERLLNISAGQKTRALLPYLVGYFRKHGGWPLPSLRADFDNLEFGIGGAKVLLGQPYPTVRLLNQLTTSAVIVVPHLSARGPNGFWTIRRGPNHPLEQAAAGIRAYHLVDEKGEPPIFHMLSSSDMLGCSPHTYAKGLDLFLTKRKATKWAKALRDDGDDDYQVVQLKGSALLSLLAHLDMAFYEDSEIALTHTGCRATDMASPVSSTEVIKMLAPAKDN